MSMRGPLPAKLLPPLLLIFPATLFSQTWRFLGPDSVNWRAIANLDASFEPGQLPRIGAATSQGVALSSHHEWNYILRDHTVMPRLFRTYRHVSFTPWSDTLIFVGNVDWVESEPCVSAAAYSLGSMTFGEAVGGDCVCDGGWHFTFPQLDSGAVYALVCRTFSKSSDNGINWESDLQNTYNNLLFLKVNSRLDDRLYMGARPHPSDTLGIYLSTDAGTSWILLSPFFTLYREGDLIAEGDTLVFAASKGWEEDSTCGIFWSSDHGTAWTQVLANVNVPKLTQDPGIPGTIYAATDRGVYRSADAGSSWQVYHNGLPSLRTVGIAKDPYSDTLYVATADSGIYQVFDYEVGVLVLPDPAVSFALAQNYPNPFNPETEIQFSVGRSSFVSLRVFDLLGREIATLVNEFKAVGIYTVSWSAAGFPSGIYFCRLSTGRTLQTRKMVLIK